VKFVAQLRPSKSHQLSQKPLFLRLINWMWVWLNNYTVQSLQRGDPHEEKSGCCRRTTENSRTLRPPPRRKKATRISRVVGVGLVTSKHRTAPHTSSIQSSLSAAAFRVLSLTELIISISRHQHGSRGGRLRANIPRHPRCGFADSQTTSRPRYVEY
jgi:hypothetical protein